MFSLRRIPTRSAAPATLCRAFSTSTARASFAKISIIGHLAAPPEVQATSTGRELIKYSLATNSGPKENRHTSWWNVASFAPEGPYRELLTSLSKGALIYVEGDATMNSYTDSEGKARTALNIVERKVEILKRPEDGPGS